RFGDYPHYAPSISEKMGEFTGWMLLSYKKPVTVSSKLDEYGAQNLTDENVKTFWVAKENNDKQWIQIDLKDSGLVKAIQINYNDYESGLFGKIPGLYHRYLIEGSQDGKNWTILIDRSNNFKDVPNDYVELAIPQKARYIRYKNIHVPTPYLSISDIRVFGNGFGKAPKPVKGLTVARNDKRRGAKINWDVQANSQGYNVLWGIAPDKLYSSWLIYGKNELELKSLNTDQTYYFAVEAFNENGVSKRSNVVKVE